MLPQSKLQRLRVLIQNSIRWGLGGDRYTFDNREMLMMEDGLKLASSALSDLFVQNPSDAIVCSGVGGTPLAAALKMVLPDEIKMCVVRDQRKSYGTNRLIEGPTLSNERVWVIDDLLNTGVAFDKVVDALREEYPSIQVVGTLILVDFNQSGRKRLTTAGYVVNSIFTLDDFNLNPIQSQYQSNLRQTEQLLRAKINEKRKQITADMLFEEAIQTKKLAMAHEYLNSGTSAWLLARLASTWKIGMKDAAERIIADWTAKERMLIQTEAQLADYLHRLDATTVSDEVLALHEEITRI